MRISAIQNPSTYLCQRKLNLKNNPTDKQYNKIPQPPAFKGELGESGGAALGMLAGVAASFVVGPMAALAISAVGLVGGGIAGDKIEDAINDKSSKK